MKVKYLLALKESGDSRVSAPCLALYRAEEAVRCALKPRASRLSSTYSKLFARLDRANLVFNTVHQMNITLVSYFSILKLDPADGSSLLLSSDRRSCAFLLPVLPIQLRCTVVLISTLSHGIFVQGYPHHSRRGPDTHYDCEGDHSSFVAYAGA